MPVSSVSLRCLTAALAVAVAMPALAQTMETAPASRSPVEAPRDPQPGLSALDIFALESAGDPQVSPDGRSIVYVRRAADIMTDRYRSSIWSVDVGTGEQKALVTGAGSYSSPRFSPDGRRLLYSSSGELRVLSLTDRSDWSLGRTPGGPRSASWSPDGASVAFLMTAEAAPRRFATPPAAPKGAEWGAPARIYDRLNVHLDGVGFVQPGATQVFLVAAEGGSPRALTQGETSYGELTWLNNGTLLATANKATDPDLDPRESEIYRIAVTDGTVEALTDRRGPDASPAVSPDGRTIAFVGYDDRQVSWQTSELYLMDAAGGARRKLSAGLDRTLSSPTWTPDGRHILALAQNEGRVELLQFDMRGGHVRLASDLNEGAGGRPYVGGSFSVRRDARGRPLIAYTQGATDRPSDIAVLQPEGQGRRLTFLNRDFLASRQMARVEPLPVRSSADGRAIDAWVALPPGYDPARTYPMILEIHGGPAIMYGPAFASEIQRFAAEGFVVVWANQRGSVGYGEEFALTIDRKYPGQDDLADLMSVVDAAVAGGYADPARLFVTGGSAGGAMTAWIVGHTDRFAAAVVVNPVINWVSTMLAGDTAAHVARHQIRATPWEDLDAFWRLSPLSRVGHVSTPTMVMVGDEDWRTPPAEAEQFYTALKLRGVEAVLARIPGAGHNLGARPSQTIAKTDNIIGWFRDHDRRANSEEANP